MYFNFIDVLLLCCSHQHVSATHVFVFRVIALRTKIQFYLNMSESLHSIKKYIFWLKFTVD